MAARTDFAAHLKREPLRAVYVLVGADPLLLSDAVAELRRRVLTAAADFNSDELDAAAGAERLLGAARTLPMMAQRRWVLGRDLTKLPAKDHGALMAYVAAPVDTSVLVLTATKLDGRTKLAQALGKAGALFSLEPPRPGELPGWVQERARRAGYSLQQEAAVLLAELIGGELGVLAVSLDKIALYAGAGEGITADHVAEVVAATRVSSIFELTDALGKRDWAQASLLMRNIVGGGQSALLVLAMLVRQLRLILQAKLWQGRASDLAPTLGVRPFVADTLVAQARRYTEAELYRALRLAARTDARLKSSRLPHEVLLDALLMEFLGEANAA
jgi:DNA polymerase-3 subunit delta